MSTDMKDQLRDYGEHWAGSLEMWNAAEILARAEGEEATMARPEPVRRFAGRPLAAGLAAALATLVVVGGGALVFRFLDEDAPPAADQPLPPTAAPVIEEPPAITGTPDVGPGVVSTVAEPPPPDAAAAGETVPPAPLPEPFTGVIPLDPGATAPDWAQPTLILDTAGRPHILYLMTDTTVGTAVCHDPDCGSFTLTETLAVERMGHFVGVPRSDGGPAVWYGGAGDGPDGERYTTQLVTCADTACDASTEIPLPTGGSAPPSIAVDESGRIVLAYVGDSPSVWIVRCAEPTCSELSTNMIWDEGTDGWVGTTPSVALRDGLPIVAFRVGTANDEVMIGRCTEPDCESGLTSLVRIPVANTYRDPLVAIGADGAPLVLVFSGPDEGSGTWYEVASVATCVDADCTDVVVTELTRIDSMYPEWSLAVGPDGRAHVAYTQDDMLLAASCLNPLCTEVSVVETGHPANDVSIAVDPYGRLVAATTSQDRDRGLEILFCAGDTCEVGN